MNAPKAVVEAGRRMAVLACALVLLALAGCGHEGLVRAEETVGSSWSEVLGQYHRRLDLVPVLVDAARSDATFEPAVLTQVMRARARATALQATSSLVDDPEAFARFERAQSDVGSALSRLLLVARNHPALQASPRFRDLQAQVAENEGRIVAARHRYVEAVDAYNLQVRRPPTNLTAALTGFGLKATFEPDAEASTARPRPGDATGGGR